MCILPGQEVNITNDGKCYSLPEAQERQRYLVKVMPTGTSWYWRECGTNTTVTFSFL